MIRGAFISIITLAAALASPGLASAQTDNSVRPESSDRGGSREPEAQAGAAETAKPPASPSPDDFRSRLSPYGDWVGSSRYGRVWRPRVAAGWRPYYYGHWTWTDGGWFWTSQEPWGWATYHYGRWAFDSGLGWIWVPGYEWAPAWVSWRFGVDAVGWAPLFPGVSVFATTYPTFFFAWTFVPVTRFVGFPVFRVAFAPVFVPRFFNFTRPAPPRTVFQAFRTPVWGGPPHRFVEQRLGRAIAPARTGPGGRGLVTPPRGGTMAGGFRGGPGPMARAGGSAGRRFATPPHGGMIAPPSGGFRGGFGQTGRGGGLAGSGVRSGHR